MALWLLCKNLLPSSSQGRLQLLDEGEERPEAKLGLRWYAAESGGGVTLGDEVVLRPGNVAAGGFWLKAMAWRAEEVPERVETLRARELQRTPERVPSVHRPEHSARR